MTQETTDNWLNSIPIKKEEFIKSLEYPEEFKEYYY